MYKSVNTLNTVSDLTPTCDVKHLIVRLLMSVSGETDAAVLPRWCGHCRERSLSYRTLRREHQTVRASVLTNKQRHEYIYCGGCQNTSNTAPQLRATQRCSSSSFQYAKTPNTDNKFSSKLEVVTLVALDCAEKRSPRCDVATVPVAMATASDAPHSYWSGSQPGSSPSHSNVRTPQHADTEVVSIRL
ncbi:hypothetical protein J6590_082036 [Homalodisca vitripennis]|nr:hypothetical protein J6590_082036 [Homalodisca vitripennis]